MAVPAKTDDIKKLKKELEALKMQSVAVLGDSEVFVKRVKNGEIRVVKGVATLEEKNSELAEIQGKVMTTSKGFNKANQIAGLSIITPEKLTLPDGNVVVNPYPITDRESGSITKVWTKKMAIGYSPTGNLVITSATLLYDVKMYFVQDVLKKVKYNRGAGRVCTEAMLTDKEKANGIFLKIDDLLGVWADFSHAEILKALETFVQKKLFAERNAQSICERLVFGRHPALSHITYVNTVGPEKARMAKVPVVGYVHDFDREEMLDMAVQAEKGQEVKVRGQKAEIMETMVTATDEDMTVEVDDEERAASVDPEEQQEVKPSKSKSRDAEVGGLFDAGGEQL